jgi:hypothetical protein
MKIVEATILENGKYIQIRLEGASDGYKYVFFDADQLPALADLAKNI